MGEWPSVVAASDDCVTDFMARGYDFIKEPLNLWENGQRWFRAVCDPERNRDGTALVLGATPWLTRYAMESHQHVIVIDMSQQMLDSLRDKVPSASAGSSDVTFVHGDWRSAGASTLALDLVLGDNSFSFLPFPDGWRDLLDRLLDRMTPQARLVTRVCSVPARHRHLSVPDIVETALVAPAVNYTAVRAELLFSVWNPATWQINTADALETFDTHRPSFDPLFRKAPLERDNDLVTVEKYRGVSATYYAPPLDEVLALLAERLTVRSVHFGPYAMSAYFPLIVAAKAR